MSLSNLSFIHSKIYVCLLGFALMVLVSVGLGCDQAQDVKKVSLEESERIQVLPTPTKREESLKIAVSAMISPKETFNFYKEILTYLSQELSIPIQLVQRETYEEVNNLLKENELDAAFVCTGSYIQGHEDFGMELLVAPVAYGKPVYYSYIIVPKDSPAQTLSDLRGKTFAFTDPMSNTGKLSPTYMLAMMGEDEKHFFSNYIFTYSHDKSIEAVAKKLVDGAAIDSLIWDYLDRTNPLNTSQTRIISKSAPYGIPPVVVPRELDMQLKEELRTIFLHMHEDAKGKEILDEIMIDRFVEVSDDIYDNVRTMEKRLLDGK
jgi:phosphate/phosphite/phosphonate ABC transporter binding protein